MANVKITDLTELAAADLATNDVLPIVDINNDATKKVTIASLTGLSDANDFITYTQLNANINVVSGNVDAVEANLVSILDTGGHTVTFSGNVIPSADGVYDLGSASKKWKDLHLTGSSIKLGGITISSLGNEGITITGTSGEQANVVTPQLGGVSNVSANLASLAAGIAAVSVDTASGTETRLNANLDIVQDNVAAEATAIQARLTTNVAITTAVEARRVANIAGAVSTITTGDLTASRALASDSSGKVAVSAVTSTELGHLDGVSSAIQTQINDINTRATANAASSGAADAVEARRVANIAGAVSTITTGDLTASRAVVSDGSGKVAVSAVTATEVGYLDGVSSAIQTQLDAKGTTTEDTALQARITANATITTAVEARRVANIAGAVSTITTGDLTASRALASDGSGKVAVSAVTATELGYLDGVSSAIQTQLNSKQATITGAATTIDDADLTASRAVVSDGSGKVAVSAVTATEIGYLDGVSSAIQTQLDAKAALAGATFTGQVNMSDDLVVTGNLTVNGDTTTVSTTNLDVEDRMIMLADGVSGSPSADVGLLFNRGNQGNAAIFYDESAKTFKLSDTKDPKSNTSLSPVTASNLSVGIVDAATLKYDGLSVHTSIADNASVAAAASAAVEARRVANIAGAVSTITTGNLTASRALASDGSGKVAVSAVTATELGYLDGVSSAIQTQINSKQATITGAATTIDDTNLTASRAVVSDGSGKVAVSAVTSTEIGYLDGVSSAIQTQLDAKGTTTEDTAIEARRTANIAGAVSTITTSDLTASRALASDGSGKVAVSAVTATELGYLDGVSSAIQTQLDAKGTTTEDAAIEARRVANIAGAISTVLTGDLTADRVMITNGSGKIAASSGVTPTELGYLDGLTLGTVAASKAVTADSNGDVNFIREVDIDGNVVIGTNASNTVTIVGVLDCGAFS